MRVKKHFYRVGYNIKTKLVNMATASEVITKTSIGGRRWCKQLWDEQICL